MEGASQVTKSKATIEGKRRQIRRAAHLADGWTLKAIGGSGKDREPLLATIYNAFTHNAGGEIKDDALLESISSGRKRYTLLHVLEFGSRPHKIYPYPTWEDRTVGRGRNRRTIRQRRFLRFVTRGGEEVFTREVAHPGTRPYAMVRLARARLREQLIAHSQKWKDLIEREWTK